MVGDLVADQLAGTGICARDASLCEGHAPLVVQDMNRLPLQRDSTVGGVLAVHLERADIDPLGLAGDSPAVPSALGYFAYPLS